MISFIRIKRARWFKGVLSLLLAVSLLLGNAPLASAAGSGPLDQWTLKTVKNVYLMGIAYGDGLFVTVGDGNPPTIMTSPDGINWTKRSTEVKSPNYFVAAAYCGGMYVVVGNNGLILTSPDGVTWTLRNSDTDSPKRALLGVTYGNGKFVATGERGTVWTSLDGITWTKNTLSNSANLYEVTYGNGVFVAAGGDFSNSIILTSPDGVNWTQRYTGTGEGNLMGVNCCNGVFIAVGAHGKILTSSNGESWTAQSSGVTGLLEAVTYGCETYVAAGDGGIILTSPDRENWTPRNSGTTSELTTIAYGNYTFCAAGNKCALCAGFRPCLTYISPNCGPTAGGTTVEISGSNLSYVDAVYFGSTAASNFTINSDTSISAVSPGGTDIVSISVSGRYGTSEVIVGNSFLYADVPFVTGISPSEQSVISGQTATFTVGATGTGLFYQWQKDSRDLREGSEGRISGTMTDTLTITNVQQKDTGQYTCYIFNVVGEATSGAAVLTVELPMILLSVTAPNDIAGVANGAAKTAAALGLPSAVTLVTDRGNASAGITWDVSDCSYDPSDKSEQTFTVNGVATLPGGVINPNDVPLDVTISVTVRAKTSSQNTPQPRVTATPTPAPTSTPPSVLKSTPSPALTPSPLPTPTPLPTSLPTPSPTSAPVTPSPSPSPEVIAPDRVDEGEDGKVVIEIDVDSLPDGATSVQLPSGEIVKITGDTVCLTVSQTDIGEDGTTHIVALGDEDTPLGSYDVKVKDLGITIPDTGKGASPFVWVVIAIAAIGIGLFVICLMRSRKRVH